MSNKQNNNRNTNNSASSGANMDLGAAGAASSSSSANSSSQSSSSSSAAPSSSSSSAAPSAAANGNSSSNNNPPAVSSSSSRSSAGNGQQVFDAQYFETLAATVAKKTVELAASQSSGTAHKTQFEATLSLLKKQNSKQFARMMYVLQVLHFSKCPSQDVVKMIDVYMDWIKRVEEEKGKMKEANEFMKEKVRKLFPSGKDKSEVPLDYEELWEILSQKEIVSCPFPEHWDLTSHELDTCCFNKKYAEKNQTAASSSERGSNNSSYKRSRYADGGQSASNVPQQMSVGWGNPMAMAAPMMQQQPTPGSYMFQQPYGAGGMGRSICGFPTPNGPCQATDHRAMNCFFNPNRPPRHNFSSQNQGGQSINGNGAMNQVSEARTTAESVRANSEASDSHLLSPVHECCLSVLCSCAPSSISESQNRMPVLRQLGSPSKELRPETNQLPSVLNQKEEGKIGRAEEVKEEQSLFDIYASGDEAFEHEQEEVTSSELDHAQRAENELDSPSSHTTSDDHSSNFQLPPLLRFGGSLTRMMQRKFSGRKGKKIYSNERLEALRCKHCQTKGHTIETCINRAADEVGGDRAGAWVRALIQRAPFHLERLTEGKCWEEIESIIEREGAACNAGNPWLASNLRRDRLRKNLGYWYVIGANSTVLSWLGYGVPMRFLTEPEPYAFRNHTKSLEGHEEFVRAEHATHVEDGSFVCLSPASIRAGAVRILNPIMVSVNKKNKPRMCHDMRWPNGYLPHVEFRMETLQRELADVVAEGDVLLAIDIAKAYYSVPLHPDAQAYLCWVYDGKVYKPTVLVFGVSPAPHVFTKIMRPWMQLCRSTLVKLMGMIDDYLFAVPPARALALARFVRFSLERLGWELNDKCQLTPQPRLCILGMIVDAAKMIVEAPVEKVNEARQLIERIITTSMKGHWIDVSILQQVCGKLQSMVLALPGVRVFTRALYVLIARALDEVRVPRYKIHPTDYKDSVDELDFWRERLYARYNGLPIHVRDAGVKLWVDASDIGWGGEVLGQQYGGELPMEEIGRSSTRRELVALLLLAEQAVVDLRNQRVHVYMDSAPAICNLVAGGGGKENLVHAVKRWFHFCETNSIVPTYEWIPREQNTTADRYSKLATTQYDLRAGVEPFIRQWLKEQMGLEPARAQSMTLFIPNFNVIPLRLESILMNMGEAVLLTPRWTSQSWWPTLLKHRLSFLYLGSIHRVLAAEAGNWNREWKMEAHWIRGRRKIHVQ